MIGPLLVIAQLAAGLPEVVQRARLDPAKGVNFAAAVVPETVTVGQQAVYQVAVFVSDEVRQRLRRNPEFVPPELRAVLAYDPPGGYTRFERVRLAGRDWEAHVFQRVIFPLTSGRLDVPPARLSYALPLSSSFFSREETYTVASPPVTLTAVEPPRAGRPAEWDGAVGRLAMTARVDARRVRVGEPVTVTLRVAGEGNINLLPRPRLQVPWGDAVAAGERVALDSVRLKVSGAKEFDWVVTPAQAGRVAVVAPRYPVFDPAARRYVVVQAAPESLEVQGGAPSAAGGRVAATPAREAAQRLPIRSRWTGEVPLPPWTRWEFWAAALVAPMPAAWRWRRRRRGRHRGADGATSPSTGPRPMPAGAAPVSAGALQAQWRQELRGLADIPVGADAPTIRAALRRAGITAPTIDRAVLLDDLLARAAFAPTEARPAAASMAAARRELDEVRAAIERERARTVGRSSTRRALFVLLALSAVGGGIVAQARATDRAAEAFAAGVTAYRASDFTAARRAFVESARLAPRAPDAWANLGTTAYVLRDTGAAAMGWHRALRLAPHAADVRRLAETLPGGRRALADPAAVWPVSAAWLAVLALGIWFLVCVAAVLELPRIAIGLAAGVGVVAAFAAGADARERAPTLAVIATGTQLRVVPALGGERTTAVAAGELVDVLESRDGWRRVAVRGGLDGWIEARGLLGLAQPRTARPPGA